MASKYAWITRFSQQLVDEAGEGVAYRRCARMGGHYDDLSVIVRYTIREAKDGRLLWQSQGEVVSLIPSYIATPGIERGSIHNRPVAKGGE